MRGAVVGPGERTSVGARRDVREGALEGCTQRAREVEGRIRVREREEPEVLGGGGSSVKCRVEGLVEGLRVT